MYEYDPSSFRAVFERDLGYLGGVARNASRFAGEPALAEAEGERTWTYAELWRDVERVAGGLAARGVRPGETVVFQLFNGPEFALCWLGAMRLGAIPTPINFRLSAGKPRTCSTTRARRRSSTTPSWGRRACGAFGLASHDSRLDRRSSAGTRGRGELRVAARRRRRRRRRSPTATSGWRRPASTPRARPGCRRASR